MTLHKFVSLLDYHKSFIIKILVYKIKEHFRKRNNPFFRFTKFQISK